MKHYLQNLITACSDESFGQDAVEWAIISGHVKLTYDLPTDVKAIMGEVADQPNDGIPKPLTNYDRICENFRVETQKNQELLAHVYEDSGLMEEILRSIPSIPLDKAA